MAGEAGAELEEAGVLDHAALLEDVGDLGEARALRMVTVTASPPSPLNGWKSALANQAMPATMRSRTPRAMIRPGARRFRRVRGRRRLVLCQGLRL